MNMENIVLILIAILGCITIAGLCYWRMTIQSRIWIERGLASTDIIERQHLGKSLWLFAELLLQ